MYFLCPSVTTFEIHADIAIENSRHQYDDQYDLRYEEVKRLLLSKRKMTLFFCSVGRELQALILQL